ncbi:phosphopantetheine-binding protein [Clostridium sp. E02]|uniref:acyl carrier protein n=1 Tax=Clostridium sp. E02 TaxID=2487134 RepID=UPI000F52B0BB|nr:phosphopantetheine-binding protein [Clostridium sp. E02]
MGREEIKNKIINFFENVSRHKDIDSEQDIRTMEFINSLTVMQLIVFIEKEFELSVDDDVLGSEQFHTINGISNYIFKKL